MKHDCDILGYCPHNAEYGCDCRYHCALGVDEDEEETYDEYD